MKVVYIYHSLVKWGGIERVWIDKMNYLADVFHEEVYLLTYDQGENDLTFTLSSQVHYEDLGIFTYHKYRYQGLHRFWDGYIRKRRLYRRLSEKLLQIHPDIIITTTTADLSLVLKANCGAALIAESHSGYGKVVDSNDKKLKHRVETWKRYHLLRTFDAIVSLTEDDAARWQRHFKRVEMIPNIVHLNPDNQYSSVSAKQVLFLGRFEPQKAIPDLVTIWQLVHKRHPDWLLAMYGEGKLKKSMVKDINARNISIQVYDHTNDVFARCKESSMLLLTSLYEPFGLVIPEAMSCGLPVVSFEGDGPSSIITDGKDGFLVKNRDIQVFADRVCQLIENPVLRKQMGQQAILSAQHYTADAIMPLWKQLFESLKNKV